MTVIIFYFIEVSTNFIIKKIDTVTTSSGSNITQFKDTGITYTSNHTFASLYYHSNKIYLVLKNSSNYEVYPYNTDGSEESYQVFSNFAAIAILNQMIK